MSQARTVASGFIAVASIVCLFITFLCLSYVLNLWIGLAAFVVLAVPFSANCVLTWKRSKQAKTDGSTGVRKAKGFLMALQGVGFACWFFDVLSTLLVIDVKHVGEELNILGWPYGALGALVFYVPMVFVTYYLLFRVKSKESFYGAVATSVLTVFMGLGNLGGAIHNMVGLRGFSGSVEDFFVLGIWFAVVTGLAGFNVASAWRQRRLIEKLALSPFQPDTPASLSQGSENLYSNA